METLYDDIVNALDGNGIANFFNILAEIIERADPENSEAISGYFRCVNTFFTTYNGPPLNTSQGIKDGLQSVGKCLIQSLISGPRKEHRVSA